MAQFLRTKTILPVGDIDDTTAWYERVFGFKTVYRHGEGRHGEAEDYCNYAIMVADDIEVHFILDEGEQVWTRAGTSHLSLIVRDVDSLFARMSGAGIAISRALQHENWPARGFKLTDPSGNDIHVEQTD